ncbi:MAG: sensor histidine kinase [Candidatus Anammoxibacter sp.]
MKDNTVDQVITDKSRIRQLLFEQSILSENLEIRIDKVNQSFSSIIVDNLAERASGSTEMIPTKGNTGYSPFSYLNEGKYLLLDHLTSSGGANAHLVKGNQIQFHFFYGFTAIGANVIFEKHIEGNGNQSLQVSFPDELLVFYSRKSAKVKAMSGSKIRAKIDCLENINFEAPVIDVCATGLSFCTDDSQSKHLINKELKITVNVFEKKNLSIEGYIRHSCLIFKCNRCHSTNPCTQETVPQKTIFTVEFDMTGCAQDMKINELISILQREYLITEKFASMKLNIDLERKGKVKADQLQKKDLEIVKMTRIVGIGTVAAGLAHEINNPLTFIYGNLQNLGMFIKTFMSLIECYDRLDLSDETKKRIDAKKEDIHFAYIRTRITDIIDRSIVGIDRMKKIVTDMKTFSRVDTTDQSMVNVNELLETTLDTMFHEYKDRIETNKEYDRKLPAVKCFVSKLNQVFMNIITNACQAIEGNGIITIRTYVETGNVVIEIADSGSGIPDDVIKKIFNPFFTNKPIGNGTGLGLSISYEILRQHKASITVKSKVGNGSTFTIKIPIHAQIEKD